MAIHASKHNQIPSKQDRKDIAITFQVNPVHGHLSIAVYVKNNNTEIMSQNSQGNINTGSFSMAFQTKREQTDPK